MADPVKKSVLQHDYPRVFLKHPALINCVYAVSYLIQLRKWYLQSIISKLLHQLPHGFSLVDAGSGEGQYLFPNAKKYPGSTFIGIDKNKGNVGFCNAYIHKRPFTNVRIIETKLENESEVVDADIVVCVAVIQYIEDDIQALRSMRKMLKPGGVFLLEVPVNGAIVLPWYRYVLQKFDNYDALQEKKRIYTPQDVLAKLVEAGFLIKKTTYTYGFFGKLGHELYNIPFHYLINGSVLTKLVAGVLINFIYPFTALFYFLDYFIPKKNGNGIIVVSEKP